MFVTRIGSPLKGFVTTYGTFKDKGITVTEYFKPNETKPYSKRYVFWDDVFQKIFEKVRQGNKYIRR